MRFLKGIFDNLGQNSQHSSHIKRDKKLIDKVLDFQVRALKTIREDKENPEQKESYKNTNSSAIDIFQKHIDDT